MTRTLSPLITADPHFQTGRKLSATAYADLDDTLLMTKFAAGGGAHAP